jgi:hypothetical protein
MGLFDGLLPPKAAEVAPNVTQSANDLMAANSFDPTKMIVAVGIFLGLALVGMIIWTIWTTFFE